MFHCELHRLEGNDKLWRDWRDLLSRARPEFRLFGPEWFAVWNRTIGAWGPWTGEMRVAAVYDDADGKLYGVLPVGYPKVGMVRVNAIGGYFQPWRLVLADAQKEFEVGRSFGWYLVELGWGVMQLGPWPMKHAAHVGLMSALKELDMPVSRRTSDGLAIARVPDSWEEYQDRVVGRKFLRKISNYERKLGRTSCLNVRHIQQPSDAETSELLAALASIEQRSWLGKDPHGHPRFIDATAQRFWAELIRDWLAPQGFLDVWLMSLDNQPVSFVFAITCGATRYVIANQYDEVVAEHRTGSILYRHMFEEGYSRGVRVYDFGTNELHYKSQWGASFEDTIETFAVATNPLVGGLWKAGIKLKNMWSSLPWGSKTESELPTGEVAPARTRLPITRDAAAKRILDDVATEWEGNASPQAASPKHQEREHIEA